MVWHFQEHTVNKHENCYENFKKLVRNSECSKFDDSTKLYVQETLRFLAPYEISSFSSAHTGPCDEPHSSFLL